MTDAAADPKDQRIADLEQRLLDLKDQLKSSKQIATDNAPAPPIGDEHHGTPSGISVHGLMALGVAPETIEKALSRAGLHGTVDPDGELIDFSCGTFPNCMKPGDPKACRATRYGGNTVPTCNKLLSVLSGLQPPSITRVVQSA